MGLEASHSPEKDLTHFPQVYGIEKEIFGVGRDIDLLDAIFCPTKKDLLWAERMCRADWEVVQDLVNLRF